MTLYDQLTKATSLSNDALLGQFSTNLRAAYAAAVLTLLPVLIVLVICQRFLRTEMFAGAVKG